MDNFVYVIISTLFGWPWLPFTSLTDDFFLLAFVCVCMCFGWWMGG